MVVRKHMVWRCKNGTNLFCKWRYRLQILSVRSCKPNERWGIIFKGTSKFVFCLFFSICVSVYSGGDNSELIIIERNPLVVCVSRWPNHCRFIWIAEMAALLSLAPYFALILFLQETPMIDLEMSHHVNLQSVTLHTVYSMLQQHTTRQTAQRLGRSGTSLVWKHVGYSRAWSSSFHTLR